MFGQLDDGLSLFEPCVAVIHLYTSSRVTSALYSSHLQQRLKISPTHKPVINLLGRFARQTPPPKNLEQSPTMALLPNPVTISRKTPLLFRFMSHSLKPTSRISNQTKIPPHPLQISGFRSCSSSFCSQPVSYTRWALFKEMGCKGTGYGLLGSDYFRVSAVSDGGSGGFGGSGGGNTGGKGDGGGGEGGDGGGSKWSLLSWYLSLLDKHPVLTKAVTGALLTLIGDLICQVMIDQVPSLDLKRTFLFTLLGLVLVGPTLHFCGVDNGSYGSDELDDVRLTWRDEERKKGIAQMGHNPNTRNSLNSHQSNSNDCNAQRYLYLSRLVPLSGASGAFSRLVLDQFLFSPIFIGVFLASLLTLEGRPSDVVPKLQQEWFSAVIANWKLWIPFQFLNFRFVPQQFQVLAANVVALVWNVILSYKAHKEVIRK
ncbi:hypothetical protein RHGRI_006623 [Rhododendron griersonianum]|uniref:Uncharacterized protein n=1 Tax=Rhododendron griersonianum TaxID=479676 RepID=A0AAV6KUY8_9ERIC|nr:hypothetical protein RHGRI_006623 [Rhododendron griersonianum]